MKLTKRPIFRMYKLTISSDNSAAFVKEGTHNMVTSIENESGTLAMFATHEDLAGTTNYVFEMYQDLDNYNVHAKSPQFKHYGQVAQKVLTGHEMQELKLQFLNTKDTALKITGSNDYVVNCSEVTIAKSSVKEFKSLLGKSITDSIANEPGTVACYAATSDEAETQWIILSVYKDITAQNLHVEGTNQDVSKLVVSQTNHQLHVDTMVSQGKLEFTD